MIFHYLLSISILCQYLRNCNGETGNVGGNFAIIKGLRRSLTGGWKADLIDVPTEEETSGSALQTRQGGGDSETLKEKTKRLVDWHLADEPLKQFDKWNPYDKDRVTTMQNKVDNYIKDKDAAIDFSGVNNLDQQTKQKFEDSIKNIRDEISKTSDPSETSTKVSSLVDKIFNTGDITKTKLESEAKKLKLKKELRDELSNLHETIENFKQPDIDLRTTAAEASGKEICRVLQGFLGIAEDRNWRTLGRKNKFKIAFGKSPDGIEFSLEYAIFPRGKNNQIVYDNDSPVGTSYNNDIFPELKKPIEQNQLEMLLKNSIDNPNIAADLSELHDKGKNDIQSAIEDVQDELKRGDIDPKLRQKIKTFAKQLIDRENLGIPSGVDDVPGLREKLEKLKSEITKFKEPRPEEQKRIAEFVLNTLENDAAHQPSFEDVPGLKENPRLQRAMADFMLITNIAEAAAPTKALLQVMKDQGITDLSKGNLDKLKEEGRLDEKWSATGRTLGLDSVMRDKLRSFIEDKTDKQDLDELFSADENDYPARDKASKGRDYGGSHQDQPLSPGPTSPGMDFLSNSDDDLMEVDDTKGVIASGLTNTENLAETTRKRAKDVEDDGEIASKQAKVDSDAEYMRNLADETLDKSLDCDTKRNYLHKKRHHWYRKKQQLSHKRQGICSVKNKDKLVLDEDSIELKGNKLEFEFYEPHNKDVKYKVSTDVDQKRLSSLKYIAEKEKYTEHTGEETGLRGKIGTAFGVHGLVMSVFGAINAFEQGNTVSGAITVAQTIHSLSSFETVKKFTDFAANIAKKALQKAVVFGAEKLGLSEVAEKAASKLARLAESDAGLLLGDIPFVGLAFDAYFIANDIKDLVNANYSDAGEVALDVVHLALDIGTTVASMLVDALGPEFEPVVWALSLIRMSIDDFYIDISTELKKAHGVGGKILAVFKGIAEGFVDFLTGGLLRGLQQLNERQRHDQDLLRNLSNPQSYYKLEGTDCKGAAGTIDFTAGAFSGQGGDISFKLNDDDSFTVTLTGVPAEGGEKQTISRKFQCPGLRDIVLGVGETQDAVWTKQKAKLWGVITVKSADVIDHFTANNGSLYGSYTGNKLNNAFYAFQGNLSKVLSDECKDPEATGTIDFRIRNYFYLLNGLAGNDTFLLGPQSAHVTGGTGHDLYYLGTHGGNTVIDNFAFDKLSDTLWLNVSHVHVVCGRKGFDLLITYCGTHMVQIKEWFFPVQNQFRQHLILLTRDGIQLKVKDFGVKDDNYQVACVPVSIDRSKSTTAQHLNLTEEQYREVVTVTGSKVSDVIIGNDKDNYINAGPGANQITGGEGADTYLLRPIGQKSKVKRQQTREYCDYINNFAKDVAQDKIFLPIDYDDIILTASTQQEVPEIRKAPRKSNSRERPRENGRVQSDGNENELTDMTEMEERPQDMDEEMQPPHLDLRILNESRRNLREDENIMCIIIENWFKGKEYKHLSFVTDDYVVFHVNGSQESIQKQPSMLDYSMSAKGISCNLKGAQATKNLKGVQTVLDSYFPDTILGNDAANFISTHGRDFIQGNGGKDIYKVTANCKDTYVNNFDLNKDRDIVFIEQNFDDISLSMENTNNSLELRVDGFGRVLTFLHWFENETYRHAALRSKDGVTGAFPQNITEMASFKNKLKATEISLDQENCSYGLKTYDLGEEHFLSVLRFTAKSDLCSYKVVGNAENNYIDPGPGNPFGYQYLEGGNGSDTYVIGSDYGEFNEINNYATDGKVDFVLLNVGYKYIQVGIKDDADLILSSTLKTNNVSVALKGFLYGKDYQHVLLQSADKVLFRLLPHYPHKKAVIVNYAQSSHSQIFNLTKMFPGAGILYGPKNKTNIIYGSDSSTKLSGGLKKDRVEGGQLGETIEGFSADDIISGNGGNDVIYGGDGNDVINGNIGNDVIFGDNGTDRINGSEGLDTVIFKGDSINAKGVFVSLMEGYGKFADAEGDIYASVEAVIGSEFNDIIEGSDDNNILSGSGGNDTIITYDGYDILVGGQDSDIYNLTTASSKKVINNFDSDVKEDLMMLGKITEPPCLYSYKDDLLGHFDMDYEESLDLMFQRWYNGSAFKHLSLVYTDQNNQQITNLLNMFKEKSSTVAADEWVNLFRDRAKVKILRYDHDSVSVKVEYTLKRIPLDKHQIALNYISEGQDYRWIDISHRLTPGGTLIKLTGMAAGVIASVSLSLHRCSQVLFMTLPVIQRTSPNPPDNLQVTHFSEVSITVEWDLPSNITDPNAEFYSFKCIAEETHPKNGQTPIIKETITSANTTSCLIDKLRHNTKYYIAVYSIAAGEESKTSVIVKQKTDKFCKSLEEPTHGMIIDSGRGNGVTLATLGCDLGYELTVVGTDDTKISTTWPTKPAVLCNSTKPCVKWNEGTCTQKIKCLEKSCDESILTNRHLAPGGVANSEYLHGEIVPVSCIDGYTFTNDGSSSDTVDITCWNGNWKDLPTCRRFADCQLSPVNNGNVQIDGRTVNPGSQGSILLNHGLTATYQCTHGYSLNGIDQVHCNDGTLQPELSANPPQCQIISCPTRPTPQHGSATLTPTGSSVHGSVFTFSCDSSYFLTGPRSQTCNAGVWSPSGTTRCNPKPCNNYPCQNGGTCHNVGNYNFRCTCTTNWQGHTCSSRKVIRSTLESEISNSLAQNGGTSNDNYRNVLFNYLSQRYPNYYWVVNSYNPVSGWDAHTIRGDYIHFFRTHGRNLGVAWARTSSTGLPSNMETTKSTFESRVRHQGCDPRTITQKAFDIGSELGLPTRMAHIVRWGNGLRSRFHTAFTFFLNYDCSSSGDKSSLVVSFGQG